MVVFSAYICILGVTYTMSLDITGAYIPRQNNTMLFLFFLLVEWLPFMSNQESMNAHIDGLRQGMLYHIDMYR